MSIPTRGETFTVLIEHLRKAQENAAMMAHLEADTDRLVSQGWLAIEELLKKTIYNVTRLAKRGLQ